jgi:tetratricopeptide (TPR) repeat protein
LDDHEAAVKTYDKLISAYGSKRVPALQRIVATAILDRGNLRFLLGDQRGHQAAHEEVIKRYSDSSAPELQPVVAEAFFGSGVWLMVGGDHEGAMAACDKVVERYIASEEPEIQQTVAFAIGMKGRSLGDRGDFAAEIAAHDLVIDKFGSVQAAKLPMLVAMAMERKGNVLATIGRPAEALRVCDELEPRTQALGVQTRTVVGWEARWVRARAHLMLGNVPTAVDTFRSAYAAYTPRCLPLMRWITAIAVELVAFGVPAGSVVEILAEDRAKSDEFAPLVVALRQLAGDEVRAAPEVLEVAADVQEWIESRRASITSMDS